MRSRYATSIKHGMFDTPEYNAWRAMKARCLNPRHKQYEMWGGRGIKVCPEWVYSFEAFFAHMGKRPSEHHSLDRIDNDGNYEPGNCRWATREEQNANKRPSAKNQVGVKGVRFNKDGKVWVAQITRNKQQIHLGRFRRVEDAIAARLAAERELARTNGQAVEA